MGVQKHIFSVGFRVRRRFRILGLSVPGSKAFEVLSVYVLSLQGPFVVRIRSFWAMGTQPQEAILAFNFNVC